jgi:hypothetical protein
MKLRNRQRLIISIILTSLVTLCAEERESAVSQITVTPSVEMGFLNTINHTIQFGKEGTQIDYKSDGGQEVLAPFTRFAVDFTLSEHHKIVALYQPLALESENVITRDIWVDSTLFPEGTPVKFLYSFPFYRLSYLYDFWGESDRELAIGFSMQIRNANIQFQSLDGEILHTNRDIGPVPILKFRHKLPITEQLWWGSEIDGFYAPVSYLNGSDEEVVGAILDASLRMGITINPRASSYFNVRYLGGGAVGSSAKDLDPGSDGYVDNWLHFLTVSL